MSCCVSGSATLGGSSLGGPRFIAGATGGIKFSFDGISWSTITVAAWGSNSVTFLGRSQGATYIAILSDGSVWTSRTTTNWTAVTAAAVTGYTTWTQCGGCGTDNLWLCRGNATTFDFLVSTDRGVTWTSYISAIYTALPGSGNGGRTWPYNTSCVAGDNGTVQIGGGNSTNDQNFVASCHTSDGITWTAGGGSYYCGAQSPYGNGGGSSGMVWAYGTTWYAAWNHGSDSSYWGSYFRSLDTGASWTQGVGIPAGYAYVGYGRALLDGSITIIQWGSNVSRATDGWTFTTISPSWGTMTSIAANLTMFIVMAGGSLYSSTDGSTWTSRVGGASGSVIWAAS